MASESRSRRADGCSNSRPPFPAALIGVDVLYAVVWLVGGFIFSFYFLKLCGELTRQKVVAAILLLTALLSFSSLGPSYVDDWPDQFLGWSLFPMCVWFVLRTLRSESSRAANQGGGSLQCGAWRLRGNHALEYDCDVLFRDGRFSSVPPLDETQGCAGRRRGDGGRADLCRGRAGRPPFRDCSTAGSTRSLDSSRCRTWPARSRCRRTVFFSSRSGVFSLAGWTRRWGSIINVCRSSVWPVCSWRRSAPSQPFRSRARATPAAKRHRQKHRGGFWCLLCADAVAAVGRNEHAPDVDVPRLPDPVRSAVRGHGAALDA